MMEENHQITRINTILESLSYWSSIYEIGACLQLVELQDLIYELQQELNATAAVIPVLEQNITAQDVVAVDYYGEGPFCAVPYLSKRSDVLKNQEAPRLQQMMQTLGRPFTPEQLTALLPFLKKAPHLIVDFLNNRRALVKQHKEKQRLQRLLQEQRQEKPQLSMLQLLQQDEPAIRLSDYIEPEVVMQRYLECLIHASQCEDANCEQARCRRMKTVLEHTNRCERQVSGDCPICKQFYALCSHHVRLCEEKDDCQISFCFYIKQKRKEDAQQELMPVLRKPHTPEEKNKVLYLFKKEKHLMTEVVRDRENFDFCVSWLVGFYLHDESSPADVNQVDPQGAQSSSLVQSCTQHKVHECKDNGANRGLATSKMLSRLVAHLKTCKRFTSIDGYCLTCKRLRNFYGHHAILCQVQDNTCPMPFCFNVKRILKELPSEGNKSLQNRLIRRCRLWQSS